MIILAVAPPPSESSHALRLQRRNGGAAGPQAANLGIARSTNRKNRVLRVPDVNLRNLSRTESNVSLALHDTNHIGGRRRRVGLATAIATRGTRAAPKTRPLSSLRDIGRFRPT